MASFRCESMVCEGFLSPRISGKLLDLSPRTRRRPNFAELGGSGCNHPKLRAGHFTVLAAKTAAFSGGVGCDDVAKRE